MPSYSSIDVGSVPVKQSTSKWMACVAVCFLGFVGGLAFAATGERETSLYTSPATRTMQASQAPVSMPLRQLHAVPQFADVQSVGAGQAEPVYQAQEAAVFYPIFLMTSAIALGFSAVKMLTSSPKVSMMSTTAVKREWAPQNGKKYKGVAPIIAPSLLAADLANLATDAKRVMDAGADVLHVDVMDGHFVPNLSWGAPVIKCLRAHTNAFFDTHLMVSNPEDFIAPMADAGVDQFTFHIEAAKDTKALIKAIKDAGMKVGISVKPKTPIDVVFPYVDDVDLILVMTVEPGFGGQSFMEDMMPKVKTLREKYPNLQIQVDGGLGPKTIDAAAKAGANAIVAGSACFVADPKAPIDAMKASLEKYLTGPGI